MATNFDFLKSNKQFSSFANVAISAEKILNIDPSLCVMNCRRAMEFAVKWMYSADDALKMPNQDNLVTLMSSEDFREIVDSDVLRRMDFIRKLGNIVAHSTKQLTREQAELCLENLFVFLDFVAYCYSSDYESGKYDKSLLEKPKTIFVSKEKKQEIAQQTAKEEISLQALIEENKALKEQLTARRAENSHTYTPQPLDLSEYKTRKIYIDTMLVDAGWQENKDWLNEVEVSGMPNESGKGYIDYALYGDDRKPLAIIEAKRTCKGVEQGRMQAKIYADILEKQFNRRPVIFLTNGFETRIIDNKYPERPCSAIYSKRDLESWFNWLNIQTSLKHIMINRKIADRYYQEAAIKAVCNSFEEKNKRKALLVMATGSGKTRTVMALCDVLTQHNWAKNILFLADRNALVKQAQRSFSNLLPNLSTTNLVEEKDNYTARCVFSTYNTMYNVIDDVSDDKGKLFTCGHFDLVISDEAHRSIYNKYKDIFNYFDAPIIGLTATPKSEVDRNTFSEFELEFDDKGNGVPTYSYELSQAVIDKHLVPYYLIKTQLNFMENGIKYEDLSEEDKKRYEDSFADDDGELPPEINSNALNSWVFNTDTIRKALNLLMNNGLKVNSGSTLGKTIIFAKNHKHAEEILRVFNMEYPHLPNFAQVIDNYISYAQKALDDFSDPEKLPQIAISVDMLDTGIDIPEILNLVFFKKVMSKAKFWQMIGRGTRTCKGLIDGKDKEYFYIFDLCGNFDFFNMNDGKEAEVSSSIQGSIFYLKAQLAYKLQDIEYQTDELKLFRNGLVDDLVNKVKELNRDNFSVKQHLRWVEKFSAKEAFQCLSYDDILNINNELVPLIYPYKDELEAIKFDKLMYSIELAEMAGKPIKKMINDLKKRIVTIASKGVIPEIQKHSDFIRNILHTDYLTRANTTDFENIRKTLRDLMKYLNKSESRNVYTDIPDNILVIKWSVFEPKEDEMQDYRAKAEFYIRKHCNEGVIAKLKGNEPLTQKDVNELERILWSEIGTKKDYEAYYTQKPLGEFVREIVGLDMGAAKKAFSAYLDNTNLDSRQIYFVNQIVEYIVKNGMMTDLSVLQEAPFNLRGSVYDLFSEDMATFAGIRQVIESINETAKIG